MENHNKLFYHDEREWTDEDYKNGLRMTRINSKVMKMLNEVVRAKISVSPCYKAFLRELGTHEFKILPYRVFGNAKNEPEIELLTIADAKLLSYTVFNKHAYMTMFIFNMEDSRVHEEPFVQIALERFYSRKKGNGAKLLRHIVQMALKHNVTLTVWVENEKLKNYYNNHGFSYEYRSLRTAHYFLTYNRAESSNLL